jgi:hypothetical protein
MFAVPAVSTAVAAEATSPEVAAVFCCVADGVAVELALPGLEPAPAGELEVGLDDGDPGDGNGRPSVGLGDGALVDGLGVGVGDAGLGMQMMPRMHP